MENPNIFKRIIQRFHKKEEGQALVEFALVLPILLILLLGIFEFGNIFFSYLVIQNASRDAARYGTVAATDLEMEQVIMRKTDVLKEDNITVTITPVESARTRGNEINVLIDYDVPLLAPLWNNFLPNPFPITAKTVMRIE